MPSPTAERCKQLLATPIMSLKGVGPRVAEKLARLEITTVADALYTLPSRYEDRRKFKKIAELQDNLHEVFCGEILAAGEAVTSRSRRRLYEVIVGDGSGQISLKWFHYKKAWMDKKFSPGRQAVFSGEVRRFGLMREVHHPEVDLLKAGQSLADYQSSNPLTFGRILPVYPLTEGLTQLAARKIWKQAVDQFAQYVSSPLPDALAVEHELMPLAEALQQAHWPADDADLTQLNDGQDRARRSLVYDEFFYLELGLAMKRQRVALEKGIPFDVAHKYTRPLAAMLPYRLTDAQRRVLGHIKQDLMAPHPMNRLVQGDVGCGKTLVALMAALIAIENKTQVAVVAPTEILAEQHYLQFSQWLDQLDLKTVLLRGKMPAAEKRNALEQIREGQAHLVVGTHAVLQDQVAFHRLGLGIIDEQHRFGVKQRAVLRQKGENPHILVMTATPIPRTLSMTLYGDLAVSVIDEMPPGRAPVKTRIVGVSRREQAYAEIQQEINRGHQVYVVYPLVEETEKSDLLAATEGAELLKNTVFRDVNIGLLHGRMSADEKQQIMYRFKQREIDLLVSTTVIEVGIDIPNATVMVIEHAERFGLAQLHQLRGRVGRGDKQGLCLLMRSDRVSEEGQRRLDVMASTTDGFKIAEADLEIRGPGEFLGTRQSGLPDFRFANLLRDSYLLESARQDAFQLVQQTNGLTSPDSQAISAELRQRWGQRLQLASIG